MSGTRRKPGQMGSHIDPFREHLLSAGYTPDTVRGLLSVMGRLGRWMQVNEIDLDGLTRDDIATFGQLQTVRAPVAGARAPRSRSVKALIS